MTKWAFVALLVCATAVASCKNNGQVTTNNRINVKTWERDHYQFLPTSEVLDPYREYDGHTVGFDPGHASGIYSTMDGTTSGSAVDYADNRTLPYKWEFENLNGTCALTNTFSGNLVNNGWADLKCDVYWYSYAELNGDALDENGEPVIEVNDLGTDTLANDSTMWPGDALVSGDGTYTFLLRGDGDAVMYDDNYDELFVIDAAEGSPGTIHIGDGNFGIYDSGDNLVFSSNTFGTTNGYLKVESGAITIHNQYGGSVWVWY